MTKITKNWINRDFNDPNGLTAASIPVSDHDSVKSWLDISGGIEPINIGGRLIPQTVMYASPNGTGTGDSFDSPISLETLRQRFSGRKVSVLIKLVLGGEYVLNGMWVVTNGARVFIEFDTDNATLDWTNNPPIICTQHTTSSYISYNLSDSRTCAAHDYNESLFSVFGNSYLSIGDVVLRATSHGIGVYSNSYVQLRGKHRVELWAPKQSVHNVCYALYAMDKGYLRIRTDEATSYDDRCGIYMYPTLPADQCDCFRGISVSAACVNMYAGYYNMYMAHRVTLNVGRSADFIRAWDKSSVVLNSVKVKHTNVDTVIMLEHSDGKLAQPCLFTHDYDPSVSDNRTPLKHFLYTSYASIQGELDSNNINNTHYTSDTFLDLRNSLVTFSGYLPPFSAVGTVDVGVHCNTVIGRLSYLKCEDVTYGTYNIPVSLVHSSNIMIDYENWATVTMNGDPNSPYSAFVSAYGSRLELNGNPVTPTVYHTNKQQAGLFDVMSGSELYERASDIKLVTG